MRHAERPRASAALAAYIRACVAKHLSKIGYVTKDRALYQLAETTVSCKFDRQHDEGHPRQSTPIVAADGSVVLTLEGSVRPAVAATLPPSVDEEEVRAIAADRAAASNALGLLSLRERGRRAVRAPYTAELAAADLLTVERAIAALRSAEDRLTAIAGDVTVQSANAPRRRAATVGQ